MVGARGSVIPPEVSRDLGQIEIVNTDQRQKLALWRLGVLGPLVSGRLRHGDRQSYFAMSAERVHEKHDGEIVRVSARTIETWYRAYLRGGLAALMSSGRADAGTSRVLLPEIVDMVIRCKREKPSRSIRKIIEILERANKVEPDLLSRSTVHRVLRAVGLSTMPAREGAAKERRSFLPERGAICGWAMRCTGRPSCTAGGWSSRTCSRSSMR